MFIETAIALFALGVLVGAMLVEFFRAHPAERRSQAERRRRIRAQGFLQVARERERVHKGTPYLRRDPISLSAFEELAKRGLTDLMGDNADWSKHADARVVSLPERRNRAV